MFPNVSQFITEQTGITPAFQAGLLKTLLIALAIGFAHGVISRILTRRIQDPRLLFRWHKISNYVFFFTGLILIGRIWFAGMQSVATVLGLASAGIAIAMKEPLLNLAGWAFILWRKPYVIGDRIQLGDDRGDVVDISPFMTTLLELGRWVHADQSTGRLLTVPNGKLFTEVLANYTRSFPFIWHEIDVTVPFESDWEDAADLLERIARKHSVGITVEDEKLIHDASRHMLLYFSGMEPAVYTRADCDGVNLTVRYMCEPKKRRSSENALWRDILREFKARDLSFAYRTHQLHVQTSDEEENEMNGRSARRYQTRPVPDYEDFP